MDAEKKFLALFAFCACISTVYALAERQARRMQAAETELSIDWDAVVDDPAERLEISWMSIPRFPTARGGHFGSKSGSKRGSTSTSNRCFTSHFAYMRPPAASLCWRQCARFVLPPAIRSWCKRTLTTAMRCPFPTRSSKNTRPTTCAISTSTRPRRGSTPTGRGPTTASPLGAAASAIRCRGSGGWDWLRNVGIDKVPETLDELYAALWKFRHEDPDGNGIQDTYGMCPNAQAWFKAFGEVFGAYGIVPHGWMLRDGRGRVGRGPGPEVKQILGLLRKWYDDGLIDPDFAIGQIKSSPMPYQKFVSGKTGYLFGEGSYNSFDKYNKASLVSVIAELQPGAEVVVGPFPGRPGRHPRGAGVEHGRSCLRLWQTGGRST